MTPGPVGPPPGPCEHGVDRDTFCPECGPDPEPTAAQPEPIDAQLERLPFGSTARDRPTGNVGIVTGMRILAGNRCDIRLERVVEDWAGMGRAYIPGTAEIWYPIDRLEPLGQVRTDADKFGTPEQQAAIPYAQLERNAKGEAPMSPVAAQQIEALLRSEAENRERLEGLLNETICTCRIGAICPKHRYVNKNGERL